MFKLLLDFNMKEKMFLQKSLKKKLVSVSLICLLLMGILFFNSSSLFAQTPLSVIVNSESAPADMSFAELKTILKGEQQRWKDDSKIMVALMKSSSAIGSDIVKKIYGMTADGFNKYWLSLVFQGKATAPVFFESENDLKMYVEKTKGAIGVITPTIAVNDKSILIDGKKIF